MSATLEISVKEFSRAAEICIQRSERTYDKFINSRALHVAKKAIEDTEKANADRIAYELAGNVRIQMRISRKTGMRKASRKYDAMEDSLAARIINARLVKAGASKLVWGKELAKRARRMIGARLRAVAFIRSGWIYAVRTLSAAVGGAGANPGSTRMTGQAKGYAKPAARAINSIVMAEIGNTALLSEAAKAVGQTGLAKAFDRERREMVEHAFKALRPAIESVSAK